MQHNSALTYWKTAFISLLYVVDLQNLGFRLDSFRFRWFSCIICRFSTCIVVCRITVFPNCYFLWQWFICILYNNDKVLGTALFRNGEGWTRYSNPWNVKDGVSIWEWKFVDLTLIFSFCTFISVTHHIRSPLPNKYFDKISSILWHNDSKRKWRPLSSELWCCVVWQEYIKVADIPTASTRVTLFMQAPGFSEMSLSSLHCHIIWTSNSIHVQVLV
jgi:hypothetical protein